MRRTCLLLSRNKFAKVDGGNFIKPTTHFDHGHEEGFWAEDTPLTYLNSIVTHLNIEAETEAEATCKITDETIIAGGQSEIPADREQDEDPTEVDVTDEEEILADRKQDEGLTEVDVTDEELSPAFYEEVADWTPVHLQGLVYMKLAEDTVKWRRTKDDQEQYIVLKLMNQILLWLEHSHFELPVSEHVYVSVWSAVFNTLLVTTMPSAVDKDENETVMEDLNIMDAVANEGVGDKESVDDGRQYGEPLEEDDESIEDLVQELEELIQRSDPGFHLLIKAIYRTLLEKYKKNFVVDDGDNVLEADLTKLKAKLEQDLSKFPDGTDEKIVIEILLVL
ncbi:hypothetical protein BGZ83_010708 [Gryganskiella cystojenkinii]|nr:hypothetical protein BGZ83_010708 [Gryganskiella cystojenkinii]